MAATRWRCVYPGSRETDSFPSEGKTYEWVDQLRTQWAKGDPTGQLTVQVDEGLGSGWQPYEHINFAEEAS